MRGHPLCGWVEKGALLLFRFAAMAELDAQCISVSPPFDLVSFETDVQLYIILTLLLIISFWFPS